MYHPHYVFLPYSDQKPIWIAAQLRWNKCETYNFPVNNNWYKNISAPVMVTYYFTTIWDTQVQTNWIIKVNIKLESQNASKCVVLSMAHIVEPTMESHPSSTVPKRFISIMWYKQNNKKYVIFFIPFPFAMQKYFSIRESETF